MDIDAFLEYDIEFALTRLIAKEIDLQKRLDNLRVVISQKHDFDVTNLFRELDTSFKGVVNYDDLGMFFASQGIKMSN